MKNLKSKQYCVYLTIYSGHVLPPYYIGSKDVVSIRLGYHGSVSSQKYRNLWKTELKTHPELFRTEIISYHDTRQEAFIAEEQIQIKLNVVNSPDFVNEAIARQKFSMSRKQHTEESKSKMRKSREKFLTTIDRDVFYEEIGKKGSATKQQHWSDPEIRKVWSVNIANGQNNRTQEEKFEHAKKISNGWKNRTSDQKKDFSIKQSKIVKEHYLKMTEEQRAQMSKARSEMFERVECPHCGKIGIRPNMKRWHFNNCKSLKVNLLEQP